jgi:copper(I)-binding protein
VNIRRLVRNALLVCLSINPALAETAPQGHAIQVKQAWARASVGASKMGVVYLTIENRGSGPDSLVGVKTPAAAAASIHQTVIEGDITRMRPVSSLPLDPGKEVTLEPGGLHIMLMDLGSALELGQSFSITLLFEKSPDLVLEIPIAPMGAMTSPFSHSHH